MSEMTVAITGASGFVGRALAPALRAAGHAVRTVGRGSSSDVQWDPRAGTLRAADLDGVDAVVHLAGASVSERWTPEHKREIFESRVRGTSLLASTIAAMPRKPRVLVSASAIGIYGSRGEEWLSEESTTGDDFLAEVGRAWESNADAARDAGIRVVHPRIGIVLSPDGGALAKMLPAFRFGAGGPMGSGRQWMSWIALDDLIGVIQFALATESLAGPVNAVAPSPVTNAAFGSALGEALHRPAILPVPAFALRLMFGEMAEATVLASQRVRATKLVDSGYAFRYPELDGALRHLLVR
jgi:uncharacterized protein (TIGR01777 family)